MLYLAFAVIDSAWQVWIAFLLYGLFYAVTEPAEKKLVTELVGLEHKGLAFGWFNFAIGFATLPSSIFFGWLYQRFGSFVAFGWGAALALIAVAILTAVSNETRTSTRQAAENLESGAPKIACGNRSKHSACTASYRSSRSFGSQTLDGF